MIVPATSQGIVREILAHSRYSSRTSLARAVGISRHTVQGILQGVQPRETTALRLLSFYAALQVNHATRKS
ncbi:MAG: hypothetical protein A3F41_01470 [Coxiella sp. RIFCSPHIGHO2_12_FULL_44_14]|nr:MAG: hypothetical protein A3F41_01470 [Coxiella sp. RIFCSPHIGHO2_12_FULL_44_14]